MNRERDLGMSLVPPVAVTIVAAILFEQPSLRIFVVLAGIAYLSQRLLRGRASAARQTQ